MKTLILLSALSSFVSDPVQPIPTAFPRLPVSPGAQLIFDPNTGFVKEYCFGCGYDSFEAKVVFGTVTIVNSRILNPYPGACHCDFATPGEPQPNEEPKCREEIPCQGSLTLDFGTSLNGASWYHTGRSYANPNEGPNEPPTLWHTRLVNGEEGEQWLSKRLVGECGKTKKFTFTFFKTKEDASTNTNPIHQIEVKFTCKVCGGTCQ